MKTSTIVLLTIGGILSSIWGYLVDNKMFIFYALAMGGFILASGKLAIYLARNKRQKVGYY